MNNGRVACIQMTSGADVSQNLLAANDLIYQAVQQGAKLIVLPEMFALMDEPAAKVRHKEALGQGPIQDFLRNQAREHGVWIVGGTIPIEVAHNQSKVYAGCLVFNERGEYVARYDKIHLFDVQLRETQETYLESKTIEPGENILVIPTPFGKLGIAVCYDVRFPELFRLMSKQGVELIALPSAFTRATGAAHWEILVRARAIENLAFVLAACQTGAHSETRKTYGHSMVVSPWGSVLASLPENPGVIVAEIDLDLLRKTREDFPALSHRRKM